VRRPAFVIGPIAIVAALLLMGAGAVLDPPVRIDNSAGGHALVITHGARSSNASAITAVSTNPDDTAVGIRGRETGRGTLKVTNERQDGLPNPNAAVLSLRAEALGAQQTNAQGVFFDAPGDGTTGKLLNLRNQGIERFTVGPDGSLRFKGVRLDVDAQGRLIAVTPNGTTVLAP
jgi:hypothetical protein